MPSKACNFIIKSSICVLATIWAGSTLAVKEQICGNERALFQCEVSGGKNLALCPKYASGELTGIQYRFGRAINKELVFPTSKFDFESFRSNYFSRYQTEYKRIAFSIQPYTYSIYVDYDGETSEDAMRSGGVVISISPETPVIQIPCTTIYIDNLKKILPHVECDSTDALGCH